MKDDIIIFILTFTICMFIASIVYQLFEHIGNAPNGYFWAIAVMLSLFASYVSYRGEK